MILNGTSGNWVIISDFPGSRVKLKKRPNKSYKWVISQRKIDEPKVKIGGIG